MPWRRRLIGIRLERHPMFPDRTHAGRRLAEALAPLKPARPVVLALPRGGLPVAAPIAEHLDAPLDFVNVRKIGAPGYPELGIGAIVEGTPPVILIDADLARVTGADPAYIAAEQQRQLTEMARRATLYRGARPALPVSGRTVILVDDGVATGATMRAAIAALRQRQPARIVVAVPVGAADTIARLGAEADEVICLLPAHDFAAVGAYYGSFPQLGDPEVVGILQRHSRTDRAPPEE